MEGAAPLTFGDSALPVPDYPFCSMGVVLAEGGWGQRRGVGFVVEDRYVLTCAANCFSHERGEYPSIAFKIASHDGADSATYRIAKVFVPKEYKLLAESEREAYNYALLELEGPSNLKDKHGSLGFDIGFDEKEQSCTVIWC